MKTVLCFSFSIFLCFVHTSHGQAKKMIRQGLKSNNDDVKIALFSKAIALDSKNLDAYFYRGLAKANSQDHIGAILDFTKVIFFEPDADTYYNRGNSKFVLGDFEGAEVDYRAALKHSGGRFNPALFNLGHSQFNRRLYKEALLSFSRVLKRDPYHTGAYTQLAYTCMALGYRNTAFVFFNMSIKLDSNTNTFYNRGIAYLELNRFKNATADLLKAIDLNKNNAPAYFYLGISYLFSKNYTAAITNFEKALHFNALDYDALIGLAFANYQNNNTLKAKTAFKKAKNILQTQQDRFQTASIFENSSWYKNQYNIFNTYIKKLEAL